MHSFAATSHVPVFREFVTYPPSLFSPKFVTMRKIGIRTSFSRKLSLSIKNETSGRRERAIQEKDAVIIVDHGSRRQESNLLLSDFVSMFKSRSVYEIVEPAHMELAEPSIKDAFRQSVHQGASRVIISPFFLFPGRHWHQDIPALVAQAAEEHSGISYIITAPIGLHELLVDVINDRINHCLSHAAGKADECSVCAGTGGANFRRNQNWDPSKGKNHAIFQLEALVN